MASNGQYVMTQKNVSNCSCQDLKLNCITSTVLLLYLIFNVVVNTDEMTNATILLKTHHKIIACIAGGISRSNLFWRQSLRERKWLSRKEIGEESS